MTGHGVLVTSSVTFVLPYKVGSNVNDSHHDQKSKDIQSMYPVWVISKLYNENHRSGHKNQSIKQFRIVLPPLWMFTLLTLKNGKGKYRASMSWVWQIKHRENFFQALVASPKRRTAQVWFPKPKIRQWLIGIGKPDLVVPWNNRMDIIWDTSPTILLET